MKDQIIVSLTGITVRVTINHKIIYHVKKRRVDAERCRRELRQVKRSALECVEYGLGACSAE
jgi:hypothetical protein